MLIICRSKTSFGGKQSCDFFSEIKNNSAINSEIFFHHNLLSDKIIEINIFDIRNFTISSYLVDQHQKPVSGKGMQIYNLSLNCFLPMPVF
jgi:hypothetical protein